MITSKCYYSNLTGRLSSSTLTDSSALKDHWIQSDIGCKWRKLSSSSNFPESFTCASAGQLEPYNTCDADQEDGIRFSDGALPCASSSEVLHFER